ncbi:nuclear transport factor 2 family protein [Thalassomonas viridans]|uniref:Nuclear transport factor 2 family protein n=2 Tax=Thalassomonas viridans TaxID=137584 RepID=A0AAF0CCD9_9GAMM|nr:nuclear transport factor 2 family protein [Thalassomonas viridans]
MPLWLDKFITTYQSLDADNLELLAELYHQDIIFRDPMHTITGIDALSAYFEALYQNIFYCHFRITQVLKNGEQAAVYWQMEYAHKRLNKGRKITVEGHSLLMGKEDKVICHRDYLDLGQMVYEHIPVLGRIILWLKARAGR